MPMMLYVHVPYCASRCSYCAFYSLVQDKSSVSMERYYTTLIEEIKWHSIIHGTCTEGVQSIFIGGGTPSYIPAHYILGIVEAIYTHFVVASTVEITIEANPESITKEKAFVWKEAGITRVSIGCQSFTADTLMLLERKHSEEDIYTAVKNIKAVGLNSYSFDLMWGLPSQTTTMWLCDVRKALDAGAQHLSCYALTVEENTRLVRDTQILRTLPLEEELAVMYHAGNELLAKYNFTQYEVSNFALEGYECAHNKGYWNGTFYYGFGPSASSYINGIRYQHYSSIDKWANTVERSIDSGRSLIENYDTLSNTDMCIEAIMLGLRQKIGFYMPVFTKYTGKNFVQEYASILDVLEKEELIYIDGMYCKVSPKGVLLLDEIIRYFIQKL